ncbi:hypothetical protein DEO72_LG6g1613 [Vigna unguiculata]|uniref:Uncharacterized protein n=1 Tax=Vigna unguiculata TaxID=3917 RepID=A0A4D6M7U8_VIGUN|nr:hypothetical protein DEO72_LG6g1613 [Vigna unguiculata]
MLSSALNVFCYLPSLDEPLQKPLSLPMTRETTTATTEGGEKRNYQRLEDQDEEMKADA